MALNGNYDYKLQGRDGWVEWFQRLLKDCRDVENEDITETAWVWPLSLPFLSLSLGLAVYTGAPMCTQVSGQVCVCKWARVGASLPPLIILVNTPHTTKPGLWVLRQLPLSFPDFLAGTVFVSLRIKTMFLFSSPPIGINQGRHTDFFLLIEKWNVGHWQWAKTVESPQGKHGEEQRSHWPLSEWDKHPWRSRRGVFICCLFVCCCC